MINKILSFLGGNPNKKILTKYQLLVEQINALEPSISSLSDKELQNKTKEFQTRIENKIQETPLEKFIKDDIQRMPGQIRTSHDLALKEILDEILPEAFAVCREASKRILNMRHFDVQLIGGIQLHNCGIAEMQTGEGKTLVCTLAAYLNALSKRGLHVVTVNDYLAQRDSEWMGKLYKFLGLSVGLVIPNKSNKERKQAYNCDITYGTNNEFGFDYLRDNMETNLDDCVQRSYYMAIVDEVDSILIDEARTPLIISGLPDARKNDIYLSMDKVAKKLKRGQNDKDLNAHYYVDEKARNVILTDPGIKEAESILKVKDLWDPELNLAHHLLQALKAKELFTRDTDYIVKINEETKKKEVVIVDEFTGRLMEGRRWSDGLHQAVEAKEGVAIQEETLTMASITFQNLFRLYPKLAGMTGTAMTEAEEFEKIYNLSTVQIPTNKINIRKDLNDVVYKTEFAKFFAIVEEIVKANLEERPVLVGTTSIEKSEILAEMLSKPHSALKVLEIRVARLKKLFKFSIQNEKLLDRPGNLKTEDLDSIIKDIDQSNLNEDARFAISSFRDVVIALTSIRKGLKLNVLNAKHHQKEAQIIREAGKPKAITIATNMAGRGTDIILGGHLSNDPKNSDYHSVDLEAQNLVRSKGGLFVIGSERHESRRIDNQLRGRCARQGDPGQSKFFLSLEDNLMRIFGGETVINIMNFLKADEDLPIEANIISGAINNSQKKVEAHNFDIRKHVLQYDDVINTQREVIYRERREILEGKDIRLNILDMIEEQLEKIIFAHINPNLPVELWFDDSLGASPIKNIYETIKSELGHSVYDTLRPINEYRDLNFETLLSEIKSKSITAYLNKEMGLGEEILKQAERQIMLHVIDTKWINHIHAMDSLKDGIHLQGYGQKDPLIEYKKESFDMFENLLAEIRENTVSLIFHSQIIKKESIRS